MKRDDHRSTAAPGLLRIAVVPFALLLLQSCGGGGSGDGGPLVPAIPQQAPGPVTLAYTGSTQAATLADGSAGLVADDAIAAMQVLWELGGEFDLADAPVGVVNRTVAGSQGGTAVIIGRIQSSTSGWLQITYSGYREQGTTLDGVEIQDSTAGGGSFGTRIRRTFDNVRIRQAGTDTTISCNVFVEETSTGASRKRVTGEFVARDLLLNEQARLENGAIELNTLPDGRSWTLAGRVSDGARGSFELQTMAALRGETASPDRYVGGGPLRIRGAGVATLWVSPLNSRSVALEIDTSGRGVAERSVRLDWSSDFAEQIRSSGSGRPAAILGNDRSLASDGAAVTLDGRFSSHSDGRLMSYRWRVLQEPPGGRATLATSDLPRVTGTFVGAGEYLVELVATEGSSSTRDVVVIEVPRSGSQDPLRYRSEQFVFAPPALRIAAGTRVDVDLTPSVGSIPGTITNSVAVFDQSSNAVPLSGSGLKPSFVPSSPGFYLVTVRFTNQSRFEEASDTAWIYVDREPWLDRPTIMRANQGTVTALAATRSGPGVAADIVVASAPPFGTSAPYDQDVTLYRGTPGLRRWQAPVVLDTDVGPNLLAADVVGDGRPDIVATVATGIRVHEQRADGSYAAAVLRPGLAGCDPFVIRENSPLLLLDTNGDGRLDVVRATACGDRLEAYARRVDGSLASATPLIALGSTQVAVAAADLNNDGREDIVTRDDNDAYVLHLQRGTGVWSAPRTIEVGGNNGSSEFPRVCLGDVNGDRRADLVASANLRVAVLLQTAAGELAPPVFYPTRGGAQSCAVTDLTRDGRNDVVLGLSYLAQRTDGSLASETPDPFRLVAESGAGLLADLDGDGVIDALSASQGELQIRPGL